MNTATLEILRDAVIGCIDVGRDQGWFILDPRGGYSYGTAAESYRDSLGTLLKKDRLCLLGIEAPGFLPRESDYSRLTRARVGETDFGQSRPWSVRAGKAATWRALPLVPALLRDLRELVPNDKLGHLDFNQAGSEQIRLLLFEAFVTSAPRGQTAPQVPECVRNECSHVWDAAVAGFTLQSQLGGEQILSGIRDGASISLFGSALLATGWSADPALASHTVHVVRAFKPTRVSTAYC
jgi:hypothetical protein